MVQWPKAEESWSCRRARAWRVRVHHTRLSSPRHPEWQSAESVRRGGQGLQGPQGARPPCSWPRRHRQRCGRACVPRPPCPGRQGQVSGSACPLTLLLALLGPTWVLQGRVWQGPGGGHCPKSPQLSCPLLGPNTYLPCPHHGPAPHWSGLLGQAHGEGLLPCWPLLARVPVPSRATCSSCPSSQDLSPLLRGSCVLGRGRPSSPLGPGLLLSVPCLPGCDQGCPLDRGRWKA